VTAVVVAHNDADDVVDLLVMLDHPSVEVIVVDNASSKPPLVTTGNARLIALRDNVGWAAGCNVGAKQALADVLAFVNPDARPTSRDLLALSEPLDDPAVGAVAPRFVNPDGTPQAFYFRFPTPWTGLLCFLTTGQRLDLLTGRHAIRHRTYDFGRQLPGARVEQPGAACLLVRAVDFASLGGFDEAMFLFFADTDLCRRLARRGLSVHVDWDRHVVHEGGGSVGQLPPAGVRAHLQHDYLVYLDRQHGRASVLATRAAIVALTGLLPSVWHLLRGRPRNAWQQWVVTARSLRT
jgi:GT2 family glycosyltransferase